MTRYLLPRKMRSTAFAFMCVGAPRITHYIAVTSPGNAGQLDPRDTGSWNTADNFASEILNDPARYVEIARDSLDILSSSVFLNIDYNKDILDYEFVRAIAINIPPPPPPPRTNHKIGVPKNKLP